MICILGDLHFRSDKNFFIEVCKNFISWFKTWKYNKPGNDLILAGDLVEQAAPGGLTISFIEQFINASNFDSVHICVGNHDEKKINSIPQLAYEFLSEKTNVFIYKEATEVNVGNKKVLMLPYYTGLNKFGMTMCEYYSNIHKNKAFKNDYDLVIGHFSGDDGVFALANGSVKNLDKLNGKLCLGHVHTREANPSRYIGSVFAGKKNENDNTRAAWILDKTLFEDPLPVFNEFITVTYPEELPESKAQIPIYTVLNCGSEAVAKSHYGDIYIRKTTTSFDDLGPSKKESIDRQFTSIKDMKINDLFKEFVDNQKPPLSQEVVQECSAMLGVV